MANTLQIKRSSVPNKVPTTSDLALGELAINTYDGKLYLKKNNGTASIVELGAGGGGSNLVVGTDVQAWDADLDAISALAGTSGLLTKNGAGSWSLDTSTYLTTSAAASTYLTTSAAASGYQPLDADLTAIAALTGSSGFLKSNGAGSWSIDTLAYVNKAGDTMTGKLTLPASTTGSASITLPHGTGPTTLVNGDMWTNAVGIFARINGVTYQYGGLSQGNLWSGVQNFSGGINSATSLSILSGAVTSTFTLGNASHTGLLTIGASTASQTTNIQAAATASGATKTINIGTGGLSGSTTTIAIGSAVAGSTTNITANGTWTFGTTISGSISGNAGTVTNGVYTSGSYADPSWITSLAWSKVSGRPTTLSGYGITDAQPLDADLTAIAALAGTSGLLKKTAADTWTLDTSSYLTSISSSNVTTALGFTPEDASNKGVANGYASLDSSGLVPSTQLPSYVDDVLEYANLAGFPATGTSGKIYVALDTNKTYRWSGSAYIEISASPGSTDAVTEGTTNLYFTTARARASISVSGSLGYNSTTGVISYTAPTNVSAFTNDSGYITSAALSGYLTSSTAASTYQPLDGDLTSIAGLSGTSGILKKTAANTWTLDTNTYLTSTEVANAYQPLDGDLTSIAGLSGTTGLLKKTAANTWALDTTAYLSSISSSDVTTALGFTPYNATNPSGYITSAGARSAISVTQNLSYNSTTGVITGPDLSGYLTSTTAASTYQTQSGMSSYLTTSSAASNYQPLDADLTAIAGLTGTSGYLKKTAANTWSLEASAGSPTITSTDVTNALGYTPYNATNPAGYITSSALSGYLTSSTAASTYQPLDGDLTSIAGLAGTSGILKKTAANTWTLDTSTYLTGITSSDVTTALGFTPYNNTNPNGYTSNTGTVTSVSGTGTVSGLTLTGTVTGSGSLTLGGTLAVSASNFASQTANTVLAAPNGAAGVPTFRALVAADIPALSYLTSNQTITLSGDASGSGSTSIAVTLANSGVTAGTYTKVVVDAKGRVTAGSTLVSSDLPTYNGTLTLSQITAGLGYTPYPATNPSGYITSADAASAYQPLDADLTAIAALAGTSGLLKKTAANTWSLDTSAYLTSISSSDVTTALGYTPYNSTNPSGYVTTSGARAAVSVTQNLTYNSTTGVITGPDLSSYLTSASSLNASNINSGTVGTAYLGSGTASASTYLRGDGTWAAVSASDSTKLPLAGGTLTGNLDFSGTGLRITGDFSNNTLSSRLLFQDDTTNNPTAVGVMPNGTGNIATWQAYNSSDLANTASMLVGITSTEVTLRASKYGTGSYLPVTIYTSDIKRFEIATNGAATLYGAATVVGDLTVGSVAGGYRLILQNDSTYWSLEQSTSSLLIKNAGTTRGTIDSSGNWSIGGGVTITASGAANGVTATSGASGGYGGYFKNIDSGINIEFFAASSNTGNRLFSGKNAGAEKIYGDVTGNLYTVHYTEGVNTANSGSAYTIDLANGSVQNITLTASCTFTMPTATAGKSFVMYLKTGAGAFTATFTGVKWAGGTAPTITTTGARMDMLSFFADGTNWYGVVGGQVYTP